MRRGRRAVRQVAWVLRRAKNALLRMTIFVLAGGQFPAGRPPYFCSHFSSSRLAERVDDLQAVDGAGVLHVFGEEDGAARLLGGTDDDGVPQRKVVKPVQVDACEDLTPIANHHVPL